MPELTETSHFEITDQLNESAVELLLNKPCLKYCTGSDQLVSLGCWNDDGSITDLGLSVTFILQCRESAKATD